MRVDFKHRGMYTERERERGILREFGVLRRGNIYKYKNMAYCGVSLRSSVIKGAPKKIIFVL